MTFLLSQGVFPDELGTFLIAALITAVIIILIVGRGADDPGSVAAQGRYYAIVCIVTLFVTLFATFSTVRALTDIVVDHHERVHLQNEPAQAQAYQPTVGYNEILSTPPPYYFSVSNNGNYTAAVQSGLIALTTGLVFIFHYRRRRALVTGNGFGRSPGVRVERAYLLGTAFLAVLIAAYATARVGFAVFEMAAPGIAVGDGDVGRMIGVSEFLSYSLLAGGAVWIFLTSWGRVGALNENGRARARR